MNASKATPPMMRILTENIALKLFSLVLAAALWYGLVGESEVAMQLPVPMRYRNVPQDLEVSSDAVEKIFLKVHGPATRLAASDLSETAVVLDLSFVRSAGEQTFTLDDSNVHLPNGIKLSRAIPSQVRLRFEQRISREVPVQVRYAGPPPQGYRIASQWVNPDRLRIAGPESRVEQIAAAQTDAIDLTSTVGETGFRIATFLSDPQVRFDGPSHVTVRVMLEKTPPAQ